MGGRPEDIAPWQAKLAQDGLNNVTITGFIPNSRLPLYQAAADILLMPYNRSISGSSGGDIARVINPMKMFDYLASGRAIAASDISGISRSALRKECLLLRTRRRRGLGRQGWPIGAG